MADLSPWEVIASRELFSFGDRLRITADTVRLPNGTVVRDYLQIQARSFAIVFAQSSDGKIVCLRQYKHGPQRVGLTLPAGGVEPGEDALGAAKRELLEETGYEGADWRALGEFAISGNQGGGTCFVFKATGCKQVTDPCPDDIEEMLLELHTPTEIKSALADREFAIASHAAAAALGLLLP
jgi:ADP-ribose pyrophosphatase